MSQLINQTLKREREKRASGLRMRVYVIFRLKCIASRCFVHRDGCADESGACAASDRAERASAKARVTAHASAAFLPSPSLRKLGRGVSLLARGPRDVLPLSFSFSREKSSCACMRGVRLDKYVSERRESTSRVRYIDVYRVNGEKTLVRGIERREH